MRASSWQTTHCRQSRSLLSARVTSGVIGALKRNIVSTQSDSRARPAKRQHHRCIGCEKPCFLPLVFNWFLVESHVCIRVCLVCPKARKFRSLSFDRKPVGTQSGIVSFALLVQIRCKRTTRTARDQLHYASNCLRSRIIS